MQGNLKRKKHPGALLPQNNETAAKLLDYYLKNIWTITANIYITLEYGYQSPYFVLNSTILVCIFKKYLKTISTLFHAVVIFFSVNDLI